MGPTEGIEIEGDKDFINAEAKALWNKKMDDKGFFSERGCRKLIYPFAEMIRAIVGVMNQQNL